MQDTVVVLTWEVTKFESLIAIEWLSSFRWGQGPPSLPANQRALSRPFGIGSVLVAAALQRGMLVSGGGSDWISTRATMTLLEL